MSNFVEDYFHSDCNLMYVIESIPGPTEDSDEYRELLDNFYSQLTSHCECIEICSKDCSCVKSSGGNNYLSSHSNPHSLKLNMATKTTTYPVIECNSLCKCSQSCGNRLVQKGPMQGLVIKTCEIAHKGLGLYTSTLIPTGTFICEYAGEIITKSQAVSRSNLNVLHCKMNYIFCLNEFGDNKVQTFVDPSVIGNIGRYINHSCEPNAFIVPVRVDSPVPKLAVFSCTHIFPNTEITFDYYSHKGDNNDKDNSLRKECLCGSRKCKGTMPFESFNNN